MGRIGSKEQTVEETALLESLRKKLASIAGVTLQDNRLVVRWTEGGKLVDVHMIITGVTTPSEARAEEARYARLQAMYKKFDGRTGKLDLQAELYYVEHGEWPQ